MVVGIPPECQTDNFFILAPTREEVARRSSSLVADCQASGVALHEIQEGQSFKGLGWLWDLSGPTPTMTCMPDKYGNMCELLHQWVAMLPTLSLRTVRSAVGLMCFLSAAFAVGTADIAPLIALRTQGDVLAKRNNSDPDATLIRCSPDAEAALIFWDTFFPLWNGTCPVVGEFSPVAGPHVIGWVDASTTDGFGGLFFDCSSGELIGFSRAMTDAERSKSLRTVRESTAYLEMAGVAMWFDTFAHLCRSRRLLLLSDNGTTVQALTKSFSATPSLSSFIKHVRQCVSKHHILLRTRYILSAEYSIADCLSHLQIETAQWHASRLFGKRFTLRRCHQM